jgi:hypothetical protein
MRNPFRNHYDKKKKKKKKPDSEFQNLRAA